MSIFKRKTKEILIQKVEDFPAILDSTVVYFIDGKVDLGTRELVVPEDGLVITGHDYFISGLFSTEDNHNMFIDGAANYAGNLKLINIFITSSGTSSKVFELDNEENFGSIEFISCNIGDFSDTTTSLGDLANYRQFRTQDCGLFRIQDGLLFTGTWAGGFRISETIILSQAASSVVFKPGVGLTFGGRCLSDINAASIDPTIIVFDFVESNFLSDGGFQLIGASFVLNSNTSVTTPASSIKAFFRNCIGINNTRPGYLTDWVTDVVTPLTLNTPTKALGATVTVDNTWFTQTANNEITYNSTLSNDLRISTSITIDGGPNDEIRLIVRKWDDSTSSYIDTRSSVRAVNNLVGGRDVVTFNMTIRMNNMLLNDRVEIWLENLSDNTDVTVLTGSEITAEII